MNQQIQKVELTIERAEHKVKVGEAQIRLIEGKERAGDYKLVWLDGYAEEGARAAVYGKANPALQAESHQIQFIKDIDAIGAFVAHGNMVITQGLQAEHALEADRNTLEELRAEGLGE